jgi:hypothetical protein
MAIRSLSNKSVLLDNMVLQRTIILPRFARADARR